MHATHMLLDIAGACSTCEAKDAQLAELRTALIDPGFQLPVAGHTLQLLRAYAAAHPGERVSAYKADVDFLKQINTATRSQVRSDELLCPAWTTYGDDDLLVAGKTDAGDGLLFVFPVKDGPGAIGRVMRTLRHAPLTAVERRRFVHAVCSRLYGPWIGALCAAAYRFGWRMRDYPSLTIAPFENVPVEDLERIFLEDRAIFEAKANGRRGEILQVLP